VVERLGIARDAHVAPYLIDLRRKLETVRDAEEASDARHVFSRGLRRDV
jgi:hypothetical protein